MSDFLALATRSLGLLAGGLLLYKFADPARRFLGRTPDYWEKQGVIRNGWSKVWREDDPERFEYLVEAVRDCGLFVWFFFKAAAVILLCAAVTTFFGEVWR